MPSVFWWKADRQDQGRDVRKKRRLAKKEFEEEVERRMQRDPAEEQVGTGDDYLLQYTETSKQNLAFTSMGLFLLLHPLLAEALKTSSVRSICLVRKRMSSAGRGNLIRLPSG